MSLVRKEEVEGKEEIYSLEKVIIFLVVTNQLQCLTHNPQYTVSFTRKGRAVNTSTSSNSTRSPYFPLESVQTSSWSWYQGDCQDKKIQQHATHGIRVWRTRQCS